MSPVNRSETVNAVNEDRVNADITYSLVDENMNIIYFIGIFVPTLDIGRAIRPFVRRYDVGTTHEMDHALTRRARHR